MSLHRFIPVTAAIALSVATISVAAAAEIPAGYPADYQSIVDAAASEGKLAIYSTTDAALVAPLLQDFAKAFPGVTVEYSDLNSTELYNRLIAESAAGQGTADIVWSSAPDLTVKLAVDGYAQAYKSPEASHLPAWANYKDTVYGVTGEPITIVYNKRLMPEASVPTSHADLLKLITQKPDDFNGKVAAYDPERSGVGFYFFAQDAKNWPDAWSLNKALGAAHVKLYTSAGAMMEKVTSGEHTMAYGIFGSYAQAKQAKDPNLGVIVPKDYALVTTRAALIPEGASHPNAAKVFLDYLLSARGQNIIANTVKLYSVRDDVQGATTLAGIQKETAGKARPIALDDTELLKELDETTRLEFIKQWQAAMKGG